MLKLLLVVAFLGTVASESVLTSFAIEPDKCRWGDVAGLWDGFVIGKTVGINEWGTFTSVGSPLLVEIPLRELETIPHPELRMALIINVLPLISADPPPPHEKVIKGSTIEVKIYGKSPFGVKFLARFFKSPAWSEGGLLEIDLEWLREEARLREDVDSVRLEIQGTGGTMITTATGANENKSLRPGILACP